MHLQGRSDAARNDLPPFYLPLLLMYMMMIQAATVTPFFTTILTQYVRKSAWQALHGVIDCRYHSSFCLAAFTVITG